MPLDQASDDGSTEAPSLAETSAPCCASPHEAQEHATAGEGARRPRPYCCSAEQASCTCRPFCTSSTGLLRGLSPGPLAPGASFLHLPPLLPLEHRAAPGIEPRTSGTRSENHATRPSSRDDGSTEALSLAETNAPCCTSPHEAQENATAGEGARRPRPSCCSAEQASCTCRPFSGLSMLTTDASAGQKLAG